MVNTATRSFSRALEAVEHLGIADFIEQQRTAIFKRLEQNFLHSADQHDQTALLFIAESLPIASAIIQVGSTMENFQRTRTWIRETVPDADYVSIMSVLTLIHLVRKGYEAALQSGDQQSKELWTKMLQGVRAALLSV